jgi:hypothetical protein
MKFNKLYKMLLPEKKDHVIKKLKNLSGDQKEELIAFFKKYPNYESKIDWNNKELSYKDFKDIMGKVSKTQKLKDVKQKGIKGLEHGVDYIDLKTSSKGYDAYMPLTHEGSKHIASKYIGAGCEGKWCTAYQKTSEYWDDYTDEGTKFIYIIDGGEKYAVVVKNMQITSIWNDTNDVMEGNEEKDLIKKYNLKELAKETAKYGVVKNDWIDWATVGSNANYEFDEKTGTILWKGGTWVTGKWKGGVWEKGYWQDGEWDNGLWKNGHWVKGIWNNGTWMNGNWGYGDWNTGIWKGGQWENGIWKGGVWENGTWEDGEWKGGTWKDGWWLDGWWYEGTWEGGEWESGEIYDPEADDFITSDVPPPEYFASKRQS